MNQVVWATLLTLVLTLNGPAVSDWACRVPAGDREPLRWLSANARPLSTTDPNTNHADLLFLKDTLRDVRVVGLGEATHGSHEFFAFKHRMIQFLITEMGFNAVLFEAPYSDSVVTNKYVMGEAVSRSEALAGLSFWTWSESDEVAELLDWLRAYNSSLPPEKRAPLLGFDVQSVGSGAPRVEQYLRRVAPDRVQGWLPALQAVQKDRVAAKREALGSGGPSLLTALQEIRSFLVQNRDRLIAETAKADYDDAVLTAGALVGEFQLHMTRNTDDMIASRDRSMADMVLAIADTAGPGARVVLWAHNAHVIAGLSHDVPAMGQHLRERLGAGYYSLSLTFSSGTFRALAGDGFRTFQEIYVGTPPSGNQSWYLSCAELKTSFIDFRAAKPDAVQAWLARPRPAPSLGSVYQPG